MIQLLRTRVKTILGLAIALVVLVNAGPAEATTQFGPIGTKVGHLDVPALGISRDVYEWGCRTGTLPNQVYHWACAGQGNIFLLGHAASVFKPIYEARRHGTLTLGMRLYWTSKTGVRSSFRLTRIAVVRLSNIYSASHYWIFNGASPAVVTLVTCYGYHDSKRIVARFT